MKSSLEQKNSLPRLHFDINSLYKQLEDKKTDTLDLSNTQFFAPFKKKDFFDLSSDTFPYITAIAALREKLVSAHYDNTQSKVRAEIRIWDMESTQCISKFETHKISALLPLANDKIISVGGNNRAPEIKIWDINKKQCEKIFKGHSDEINQVLLLPNNLLASCSIDKTLKIWDIQSTKEIHQLSFPSDEIIVALSLLPDGRLVTGDDKGTIKFWDIKTGKNEVFLKSQKPDSISANCIKLFKDSYLIVGYRNGLIKLLNYNTKKCDLELNGHTNAISALSILSDERIVSSSQDKTLKIWNMLKGQCELTIENDPGVNPHPLIVLPDETIINVSCAQKAIQFWRESSRPLNLDDIQPILDKLPNLKNLTSLNFKNTSLKDENIPALIEALKSAEKIVNLNIQETGITSEGLKLLYLALSERSPILQIKQEAVDLIELQKTTEKQKLEIQLLETRMSKELEKQRSHFDSLLQKLQKQQNKMIYSMLGNVSSILRLLKTGQIDYAINLINDTQFLLENVSLVSIADKFTFNQQAQLKKRGALLSVLTLQESIQTCMKIEKALEKETARRQARRLAQGIQQLLTTWQNGKLENKEARIMLDETAVKDLFTQQQANALPKSLVTILDADIEEQKKTVHTQWSERKLPESEREWLLPILQNKILHHWRSATFKSTDPLSKQLETNKALVLNHSVIRTQSISSDTAENYREHLTSQLLAIIHNNLTESNPTHKLLHDTLLDKAKTFFEFGASMESIYDKAIKKLLEEWFAKQVSSEVKTALDELAKGVKVQDVEPTGEEHTQIAEEALTLLLEQYQNKQLDQQTQLHLQADVSTIIKHEKPTFAQIHVALSHIIAAWHNGSLTSDQQLYITQTVTEEWVAKQEALRRLYDSYFEIAQLKKQIENLNSSKHGLSSGSSASPTSSSGSSYTSSSYSSAFFTQSPEYKEQKENNNAITFTSSSSYSSNAPSSSPSK